MGSVPTETDTEETGQSEQVEEIDETTFKKQSLRLLKVAHLNKSNLLKNKSSYQVHQKSVTFQRNKRKEIIDALEAQ